MCGIAGIFLGRQKQVSPDVLNEMAKKLSHRGPDHAGVFCDGPIGLAHTRLSIIDLEGGDQPLKTRDGSVVLIANGEIYNHVELRKSLSSKHVFSTRSDCETILHAYCESGMDFLPELQGMFAIALYDKTKKQLVLARDRLGIKPLFYTIVNGHLYFASEIKALLAVLPGKPSVNPKMLMEYLQQGFCSGRDTMFEGVQRVLPGEAITMDGSGAMTAKRFWSATEVREYELPLKQAIEEFDALMQEVVKQHLRSDVPHALFLSSGMDSSALLALLSRYSDRPTHCQTLGFTDGRVHNEIAYAAQAAEHFHQEHSAVQANARDLLKVLPSCIFAADELMGDYANLPTMLLAKNVGQQHKVVFSGEGGDEVFAGYGRYRRPWLKRMLYALKAPGSGGFRTRGICSRIASRQLLGNELLERNDFWRDSVIRAWQEAPAQWTDLRRMQYVDLQLLSDSLLVKVDRNLMAYGVEGRVPFLDHRVVEFGLSLPDYMKINKKTGKWFMRQWMDSVLPPSITQRRKRGFTVPLGAVLDEDALNVLKQRLPDNPGIKRFFKEAGLRYLLEEAQAARPQSAIWGILQFAIWYSLFIDGASVSDGANDPLALVAA